MFHQLGLCDDVAALGARKIMQWGLLFRNRRFHGDSLMCQYWESHLLIFFHVTSCHLSGPKAAGIFSPTCFVNIKFLT